MIDEREIIRREEVDFRGVVNRLKRGWPIVALSLLFWLAVGAVFQVAYPPYYTAKTTVLTEEPKGEQDPGVLVTGEVVFKRPEDYYFNNQRIVFASYPMVQEAIIRTGLITYFKSGLINREIYSSSPFTVELDSTYMSFERNETPYATPFYINFDNFDTYRIEAEGEYPLGEKEFYFEGEFQFGEWVSFDRMKFRVIPADTLMNPSITLEHNIFEDEFGFQLIDLPAQTTSRIKNLEVIGEDLESTVFTATLSGTSADRQRKFLEELGEVFITNHMELKTQTLRMALDFLEQEIEETARLLEDSEDSLKYFKSENAITSINEEGALLLTQSAQLQEDKVELVVRDKYYRYLEDALRTSDDYSTLISPEAFGVNDAFLIRLTQELVDLQLDLKALESQNAQANPAYNQVKNTIANKRATILRSVEGFRSSNQMKLRDIRNRISEIDRTAKEFPKEQSELLKLERRFRINETLYTSLMEKKSNVELTLVSTTPDFRIIEPAHLTTVEPIIPWAPLTLAVAIVLGLVTGLGLLILIWIFRSGIDNAGDIARFAPTARLLGEIHYTNIQKPLELRDYPLSPLANQLNGLIYNLGRQYPEYSSVAISSNKPKEGKSFLASMLAMQYAEMGDRVLLIDADLSNRSVAKLLRVKSGTQELNSFSVAELNESIIQTGDSQIDLLLPGKVVFKNAEVASFNGLLEELKKTYDRIIIDTPSIGKDARSLALLNSVDIPIIVVRRRKTDVHDLTDLQRTYASGSLKALNVVMTGGFYPRTGWNLRKSSYSKGKKFSLIDRAKLAFVKV